MNKALLQPHLVGACLSSKPVNRPLLGVAWRWNGSLSDSKRRGEPVGTHTQGSAPQGPPNQDWSGKQSSLSFSSSQGTTPMRQD